MRKDPRPPDVEQAAAARKSFARGARGAGPNLKWRCHDCGEIHRYWAAAERHADQQRHYRIEVVLP